MMEHDDLEEALVDVPEGEDGGDDGPLAAEDDPETDSDNEDGNRNVHDDNDNDENDDHENEDENDQSQKDDSHCVTTKNDPSHTMTSLNAAISKSTTVTTTTTNKKKKGEEARRSTEEFDLIRTTNEYGDEIIRVQALIKTRGRDKIWEFFHDYINPEEPSKRYKAQCIFCNSICKGEPRRLKHHLLNKCHNCPHDIHKKVGQTTEVERALKEHNAPAWVYEYLHGINDNVLKRLDSFKSSLSAQITAYENQINLQFDMANQRITNLERHLLSDSTTTTTSKGVTDPYWGNDHDQNEFQNTMTMEFSPTRGRGQTTSSTRKRRTRGGEDKTDNQNKVVVVKKVVTL